VLNLPSTAMVEAVDRLAFITGLNPVPPSKLARGYRYEADKFAIAGLTRVASETVNAPRVAECPVQLEATLESVKPLAEQEEKWRGRLVSMEVRIRRIHLDESILIPGEPDRIDPDKWRPLIMNFQHFYGLTSKRLHDSALARIPERMYQTVTQ
jgi:flavin reductase (DIM6/NTAB) family NADH-FMN oxidoreductase RutF